MPGPFAYRFFRDLGSTLAPTCEINVSFGGQNLDVRAILDTGSSRTLVPYTVITFLSLPLIGEEPIRSVQQTHSRNEEIYRASINFLGFPFLEFPVFRVNEDFAIIGRDILNRYYIQLNGPQQNFRVDEAFVTR